jgi:sulfur carrier protein
MQINIRLLASFRRYLPEGHNGQASFRHQVPPGARVGEVLAGLPIPPGEVYTFFVNGRHASRDHLLQEGDTLAVFPAVGGGQ